MKKFIILFLLVVILNACNSTKKGNATDPDKQMELLKAEVSDLQTQAIQLSDRVSLAYTLISAIKNSSAFFTPSSTGYFPLHTDMGNFILVLKDLKKYANGYKAVFLIGNPNYMTFNDVKLSIHWGKAYSSKEDYVDWYNASQSQETTISKPLLPGTWNKVTVVLSPATANEVGTIVVSLEPETVFLDTDMRRDIN